MPRRERVDTGEELIESEDEDSEAAQGLARETPSDEERETDGRAAAERARTPPGAPSGRAVPPSPARLPESDEPGLDKAESSESTADESGPGEPGSPEAAGAPLGADRPSQRGEAASGKAERLSLGLFALLTLAGALLFFKFLYGGKSDSTREVPARSLATPIRGELITLSEVAHYWRSRQTEDRGRSAYAILPEVLLKLDPGASKHGYVRIEFTDSDGALRGDVMSVKFENGKFISSGRAERISADGFEVTLAGTEGFTSSALFQAYLGNQDPRWTLRLQEGSDYSSGPWKPLGFVEIRNEKK